MAKDIKRVLSGIKPTGSSLHIANYFGAVKPHIKLQDEADEAFYFIADLHALTTVQDKERLEENIRSVTLDYLALGLDPDKCVFFRQSDIAEHGQLAVILANYVSLGRMKRMHAYKDIVEEGVEQESINMGLFNYPILMAADILLYKPDGVPVGDDQRQHVEVTRDIARRFNHVYGKEVFPVVELMVEKKAQRIIGTDGKNKMSKSKDNIIEIFADEEKIREQIMGSYTDPNRKKASDPGTVEGNPVFVYHDLINDDKEEVEDLKERYKEGKVGDVEVKEKLVAAHKRLFESARERKKELEKFGDVDEVLKKGSARAEKIAKKTLSEVYETIGVNLK